MSSVTGRIKEIRQPRGGYIKPSQFTTKVMTDGNILSSELENIHGSVVGMAVDYLTRYMMGTELLEAFSISIQGARMASIFTGQDTRKSIINLLIGIESCSNPALHSIEDYAIECACKMVTFDVWFRNPLSAISAKTASDTNPNSATVEDIRVMVQRSLNFWEEYGPITKDGFTFEAEGYTETVDSGDGDFLTADTLWDFKVSKGKLTSKHTLQLLMYWIMGQHSGKPEFKDITKLGIFNPRLNTVHTLNMSVVPNDIIRTVERDVICY